MDGQLIITMSGKSEQARCPYCLTMSGRVHSRYWRQPSDLPCFGYAVQLHLKVRRFFCDNEGCGYVTFAERFAEMIVPYARRTARLGQQLEAVAFVAGGEAGARLLGCLGMWVSPDTLLRIMRDSPEVETPSARVVGVDDWAIKKGQTYGTIIVDLEKQQPIDLLPERSAETLAAWLQAHPEVEIISRDRGTEYIKGATEGAPQAIQVADRWHLLKNVREAIEGYLERDQDCLKAAAQSAPDLVPNAQIPPEDQAFDVAPSATVQTSPPQTLTKAEQDKQARRTKRLARYEAVMELHAYGLSNQEIARRLQIDAHTVGRYIQADSCPFYPEGRTRPSKLDPYLDYIANRWQTGCHNATEIWREICQLGFTGSRGLVSRWALKQRQLLPIYHTDPPPPQVVPWAPSRAAWLFIKSPQTLKPDDQDALDRIRQASPKAAQVYDLGQQFVSMIRDRQSDDLTAWLEAMAQTKIRALTSLANGLKQDLDAVRNALSLPWSNGQVEGQVNRLKLIKRQMYGRANFDLLRKRVLHPNPSLFT